MTTSNGSANPLYPFNWLDAMRANAWAPPSLPLLGDGVARSAWDRFPRADAASARSPDPESAAASARSSATDVMASGGATGGSDVTLDGPRAAPMSWDSFPLAQPTTGVLAGSRLAPANPTAGAPALPPGFAL